MGAATAWQAWTAAGGLRWYSGLVKPAFSPAPVAALAVSCALAVLLALAFYRVLRRPDYLPDRLPAVRLFLIALAADALWTWMFFAGRHPTVALGIAAILAVLVASAVRRFAAVDRGAGLMSVPWVVAAAAVLLLDLSIALLNG